MSAACHEEMYEKATCTEFPHPSRTKWSFYAKLEVASREDLVMQQIK